MNLSRLTYLEKEATIISLQLIMKGFENNYTTKATTKISVVRWELEFSAKIRVLDL